ncbi:TraB/GumN family protein [Rahnella sp. C60]|uniref:TraB/GumN family protein n=1 Tax=Rahnella TaxID=34037 RepID=UPI001C277216|nr:TraB/GumN family protein [Rahnella perminowiae]MBU9813020.1 TraB/GumN family protein [Rahnella perminowiae]MBU9814506.1 TraB/GumN family protein [Rahnella perminowiae]
MAQFLNRVIRRLRRLFPVEYSYPAIDIQLPGNRALHLVGSIHMGTQDMQPLPAKLLRRLQKADALIVEADISTTESPFSMTGEFPPLAERLPESQYLHVERLCEELGVSMWTLNPLPSWQIALMLQATQAQRLGLRGHYGIDYQLLQTAKKQGKKIIELEGPQEQFELLQHLPDDGLALLEDTLTHWQTNARLLQTMISWWLDTKPGLAAEPLPNTFSSDLYDILMNQRNLRWKQLLLDLPPGHYVVAVGALHLYGEGNLPELLKD